MGRLRGDAGARLALKCDRDATMTFCSVNGCCFWSDRLGVAAFGLSRALPRRSGAAPSAGVWDRLPPEAAPTGAPVLHRQAEPAIVEKGNESRASRLKISARGWPFDALAEISDLGKSYLISPPGALEGEQSV